LLLFFYSVGSFNKKQTKQNKNQKTTTTIAKQIKSQRAKGLPWKPFRDCWFFKLLRQAIAHL